MRKHHPGNLRVVGQHVGLGGLRCGEHTLSRLVSLIKRPVDGHRLIHGGGHETVSSRAELRSWVRPARSRCTVAACGRSGRAITFGLVNVPIRLYSATEDHDVDLHQVLHDKDGGRIRYQRRCEMRQGGRVRPHRQGVRGGSTTVVLTEEDLKSLPEERSREIEVVEFVPSEQIDPIMFDRSYFLEPEKTAVKAVRAASADPRGDRPHGHRAVLAAPEDAPRRAACSGQGLDAAVPALG